MLSFSTVGIGLMVATIPTSRKNVNEFRRREGISHYASYRNFMADDCASVEWQSVLTLSAGDHQTGADDHQNDA